ncbi:HNH endonuclease [Sediminibacillus sp. JSM 1682029]|uniref:HNH endonuclease n=1 Tax=Sediminibacillus sp. JSM 1682029 TaxID=3229857 RepID=UPI003523229C
MNDHILKKISQIIIDSARKNETIEYNQISKQLGGAILPIRLNEPLGEISFRCIKHGFPPLSSIVVSHDTGFPGEGFFTWVAAKMGHPDLAPSKWDDFYSEQKNRVFNCGDWDSFIDQAFSSKKGTGKVANNVDLNKILASKGYLQGEQTQYYILTVKAFYENQQKGPYKYHVVVLEGDRILIQSTIEDNEKKQLLTPAKRKGIQLLLNYDSGIVFEEIKMMHYKPDRKGTELWEKEPSNSLNELILEERSLMLQQLSEEDIDSEKAQEESYYKDGKAIQYYGTRYERNPFNRGKAIAIHGVTCKACGFNFEEVYGERGKDFIEVHHIQPLYVLSEELEINPEYDLVPVCSNCHRMIHRKKDKILSIQELKDFIKKTPQ